MQPLSFTDDLLTRKPPTGVDVDTTLAHFAIITYLVDPEVARAHIHPRFQLDCIELNGREYALLSVVPFLDLDFRLAKFPWPQWRFGQTNYRIYVTDTETGEHVAWFFGTSLDSFSVLGPRYLWKLPWHKAKIDFDCDYDAQARRYTSYHMKTTRSWADAEVELNDTGKPPTELQGFDDLETGLVLLTHPRKGFFFRRDGRLGSYSIWHDRLHTTIGNVVTARFELLDQLGIVQSGETSKVHSVLMQNRTDFTIYLPPRRVDSRAAQAI